ncbi:hypothetical protein KZZ52_18885 [Dactylosporangium sp. AC04546]|uniref:hypothetical protein n=1 Tax=Dactylosporangium sp. AC04546 TaxID=2862460 RepID=UPI001EE04D7C|nr:hypothetical protein [Dactylosporangium sp. AC04546]WVK87368.1 hypothetical protein KZZ52_18885 [Dactylosporangium sp. AC04546]
MLRRYDLPAEVVHAATQRRLAGDWRGACAAAGIEVDATVTEAASDVGSGMLDDLRHLAPDLIRWHLLGGDHEFTYSARPPVLLARDPATGQALTIVARLARYGPTRLVLAVGTGPVITRWDSSRHLWDARHTDRLRQRLGGGDRTPHFHRDGRPVDRGDLPEAAPPKDDPAARTEWEDHLRAGARVASWRAAGVEVAPEVEAAHAVRGALLPYLRMSLIVPAARDLLGGSGSGTVLVTRLWHAPELVLTLTLAADADPVLRVAERRQAERLPAVPSSALSLPWFFEPLLAGHLPATALHPLVRAAMFPDAPDEPYASAPGVQVPERVHVQCVARHYVGWRAGRLEALDHTPDDMHRERALQALGGRATGCLAVLDAWAARTGTLPRQIRRVTRHLFLAASHGDAAEVRRLLDAGVDPRGARGLQRQTLLHVADRIGDVALIRRLRAAGVDPLAPDNHGWSAVRVAEAAGAPAPVLDALRIG